LINELTKAVEELQMAVALLLDSLQYAEVDGSYLLDAVKKSRVKEYLEKSADQTNSIRRLIG